MPSPAYTHAIVRPPSRSLADCQLVHLPRQPFDFDLAVRQHRGYVSALELAGLTVTTLPEAPDLPDATFVEDAALILDEGAVLCRPGAVSRLAEPELIRRAIDERRQVYAIRAPATLEGGDVLRVDRTLFVGRSSRTNAEGIQQLAQIVTPLGYDVKPVAVSNCLHLKTAITSPGGRIMIANPAWVDRAVFSGFEILPVPTSEPWGANTLPINGRVLVAASAPRTADLLHLRGLDVRLVDVSELQKAEAGLTCLSLLS